MKYKLDDQYYVLDQTTDKIYRLAVAGIIHQTEDGKPTIRLKFALKDQDFIYAKESEVYTNLEEAQDALIDRILSNEATIERIQNVSSGKCLVDETKEAKKLAEKIVKDKIRTAGIKALDRKVHR